MLGSFLKRLSATIGTIALWVYAIVDFFFDWIGRSTVDDDAKQFLNEKLPTWADWLFSTPSWVPAVCALVLTLWLIWLSRPHAASQPASLNTVGGPASPPQQAPSAVERIGSSGTKISTPDLIDPPSDAEIARSLRALREFLHGRAAKARSDLEAVLVTMASSLSQHDASPCNRALAFFVCEAVYKGHRQMIKLAVKDLGAAILNGSLADAQDVVSRFIGEYVNSRSYIGMLGDAGGGNIDSVQHLKNWLQSDRECLMRLHELACWPTLGVLKPVAENAHLAVDTHVWRGSPSPT
jgi:hypothetical protein